jgi:outer membrane scaffolding protein for murein synthesis (MipA/OmpV family)
VYYLQRYCLLIVLSSCVPLLLLGSPSRAHNAAGSVLVPSPSVTDFTRGDGWGVGLGVGVEYEAAYDGSDEYELEVEPAGAVQWRAGDNLFFWEGMELGWRGLVSDRWLMQGGIRYESGLEPDDSDDGYLDGIEERDSHVVGFAEARRELGREWRNWIAARVMGGPGDFGWLGVLAAGHRFGERVDGNGTEIFLFSTFGTADFINKDFGVTAKDAASSGLPETELDGGFRSVGVQIIDRRYLSRHIQIVTQAGFESYSSDIGDSPIARDDYEYELGISVIWHF